MIDYHFNFDVIWRNWDKFAEAIALGLGLAAISLLFGAVLGLGLAFARVSGRRWLDRSVWLYVELVRNTPLLLLIFFVYFGLPEFGIYFLDKYDSFVLTLSLYAAAYLCEVFRAGLASIPAGYIEAAKAIGMRPVQRARYVTLPLMFRISLPAMSNNFISLFKDTSLAAAIAIPELTFTARQVNANTYRVMEAWFSASVLYLAAAYLIAYSLQRIERRYAMVR